MRKAPGRAAWPCVPLPTSAFDRETHRRGDSGLGPLSALPMLYTNKNGPAVRRHRPGHAPKGLVSMRDESTTTLSPVRRALDDLSAALYVAHVRWAVDFARQLEGTPGNAMAWSLVGEALARLTKR